MTLQQEKEALLADLKRTKKFFDDHCELGKYGPDDAQAYALRLAHLSRLIDLNKQQAKEEA